MRTWGHFGTTPGIQQVVFLRAREKRPDVPADGVIGEDQTVIKSPGRGYRDMDGVSRAAIPGKGSVALILDIPGILRRTEEAEKRSVAV